MGFCNYFALFVIASTLAIQGGFSTTETLFHGKLLATAMSLWLPMSGYEVGDLVLQYFDGHDVWL